MKKIDWPLVLTLLVAAFFRFYLLDLRPAHHDEGVTGWFADQIAKKGLYRYDPTNYHGPFIYYITLLSQSLFGRNLYAIRLPTVIISLLTICFFYLFSKFFNRKTCLIAALALAISPAEIYFARYINIDNFLVFFTILFLWGVIGLHHKGTSKYLWACGLAISGMIITKETYIIHLGSLFISWICLVALEKVNPSNHPKTTTQNWTTKDFAVVFLVGISIIAIFYSGMFLNLKGILDIFETYRNYLVMGTAHGGHEKPFVYWLNLFLRYEHLALCGFFASFVCIFQKDKFIRYVSIYGILVLITYSSIRYKTPWCIVNLLWPFYFTFGYIFSRLIETNLRPAIYFIFLTICLFSGFLAYRINFIDYTNHKIPYVYVQTYNEIKELTEPLFKLVKKDSSNYSLIGHVIRQDEWPLPWVLGDFTKIGYYGPQLKPQTYDADFLFVESKRIDEVEKKIKNKYFTVVFTLRDSQDPSKLYLSYEKFKELFPKRNPEFMQLYR